ncbi:hypothetical protein [Rhizobium leguminosarum]|uniref:hypothetical protein n=1 Tax=Rhizobium leguminosarum TaxID=384 RepID=UPI0014427006|nr:hypothetical protein [Rhizobium leguminosarum]NKL81349.1 hypothetical protein [Rhizobium leguminosarum bv. viciae]
MDKQFESCSGRRHPGTRQLEIARLHVGNRVQRGVAAAAAELSLRIFETVDRAVRALRRMDFGRAAKHALRKAQVIATSVC